MKIYWAIQIYAKREEKWGKKEMIILIILWKRKKMWVHIVTQSFIIFTIK